VVGEVRLLDVKRSLAMNIKSHPRRKFVSGIKPWMLCLYFVAAPVVTLLWCRAGMSWTFPIIVFSVWGTGFMAFYLLERWTDKRKTPDDSEPPV
jgi:hypothetical protein